MTEKEKAELLAAGEKDMNRLISSVPARFGWYVQVAFPSGRLQWIPCVGTFQEAIDQALQWEPEEGEAP